MAISVVINTLNEEEHIEQCLKSVTWADEIVVYDANSDDKTREIAKKYTEKIYIHNDRSGYVEPQRNGAIEKASNEWILIIDTDEEVPQTLAEKLKQLSQEQSDVSWYEVPRYNFIFGKWFTATGWWPDYNIRFFKKGAVTWTNEIHVPPTTQGKGAKLEAKEAYAFIHHHYDTLTQFLTRLNKYSDIQAQELVAKGYTFSWPDILHKPVSEFLTRFFVWEGYKDGLHGLALSLLQAFSFLVVYLKVWERQGFEEVDSPDLLLNLEQEGKKIRSEVAYWHKKTQKKGLFGIFK